MNVLGNLLLMSSCLFHLQLLALSHLLYQECEHILELRYRLLARPVSAVRYFCKELEVTLPSALPAEKSKICRLELLWKNPRRAWFSVCTNEEGRAPVFPPRYYRLRLSCQWECPFGKRVLSLKFYDEILRL